MNFYGFIALNCSIYWLKRTGAIQNLNVFGRAGTKKEKFELSWFHSIKLFYLLIEATGFSKFSCSVEQEQKCKIWAFTAS